jgi:hypothetical protein
LSHGRRPFEKKEDVLKSGPLVNDKLSYQQRLIILQLLFKDQRKRLGYEGSVEQIKEHAYFKDCDWNSLYQQLVPAPYVPSIYEVKSLTIGEYVPVEKEAAND